MDEALKKAIEKAGGHTRLAEALQISPQAVYQWQRVPVARVLVVESFTGVSRHDLRPDVYGPAPVGSKGVSKRVA